mmetsp:Transcript_45899/g.99994  ORF Transcript_45899/g.99994 Transcript_45899/m.99994 type:complete len:220 (-) Transcript_45899:3-662(-)
MAQFLATLSSKTARGVPTMEPGVKGRPLLGVRSERSDRCCGWKKECSVSMSSCVRPALSRNRPWKIFSCGRSPLAVSGRAPESRRFNRFPKSRGFACVFPLPLPDSAGGGSGGPLPLPLGGPPFVLPLPGPFVGFVPLFPFPSTVPSPPAGCTGCTGAGIAAGGLTAIGEDSSKVGSSPWGARDSAVPMRDSNAASQLSKLCASAAWRPTRRTWDFSWY